MNRHTRYSDPALQAVTGLAAGLMLLASGTARAAAPGTPTSYKIQPIVKLGDTVADVKIRANGHFEIGALNDSGQIAFVTDNAAGGEMLIQYANGQFIPIVVAGRDAPGGKWATGSGIQDGMNQRGDIAFAASATIGGKTDQGTFRWDYQAQKVTPVALKGMPAVNNLTFVDGNSGLPVMNNNDEIAFAATVKNAAGAVHSGVFFLGRDGQLQAVALPDQVLPGGAKIQDAFPTDMNDAGDVAFVVQTGRSGYFDGAYVWEKGTITPVALPKQDIPGVGTIASNRWVWLNNQNRNVMVDLNLKGNGNDGLYLFAYGSVTPLEVPGQAMPDGGTLLHPGAISGANDAGQRAFFGWLKDGTRSAYLLDADGTISPVLKTGATTDLGKITNIFSDGPSFYIGFNNKGQVALNVALDGVTTMVVLTPTAQ